MNKIIKYLIVFMFLPSLSLSEQIKININAIVIERSCTISNNSINLLVTLDSNDLKEKWVGIPFTKTPFSIVLENCPKDISSAHITFTGESDTTMTNFLKNLDKTSSSANNIAIGIYDSNQNVIDLNNNLTTLDVDHSLVNNVFRFYASYIITSNNPSAGKVISVANFELSYD
ncbi:fimbrial protein (plasmid) [Providencia rettgeri]|uniref:fimbrial protein n=1 Tax=Providencia rettgeri TaxID=587 RepID=UPI001CA781AA|nr:fimbrial protein [Providencia rettgeri]QZY66513.1 fimbrial protein [Providencia rettgeri]